MQVLFSGHNLQPLTSFIVGFFCLFLVLGQIRTTSCQGRLLMRKKLKQYIGLVDMAESNSGERKTTHQDLQVCDPSFYHWCMIRFPYLAAH